VLGRDLPLSVLLEGATVAHLATVLRQGGDGGTSPLVAIRPEGAEAPWFCVHPSGGSVLCYRQLARALGGGRPFFGLQSPALLGAPLPHSVEELAELFLGEIATVRPRQPYLLAGWSMGGVVAFEMARRLAERGEPAALLVLIDAVAPDGTQDPGDERLAEAFDRDVAAVPGGEGEGPLPPAERRRLLHVFRANYRAMLSYRPRPHRGPAVVLAAERGLGAGGGDPALGWRPWVADLEARWVPGDHYTAIQPPALVDLVSALEAASVALVQRVQTQP
jgi:pyochelin synthetase